MSTKTNTTIPQSRISRTHRVEIPVSMNMFKLPSVGPKTGKLSAELFNEVTTCIDEYTTSKSGIKGGGCDGKTFVKNHGKKAVVQNRNTGEKYYKPEKRNCRKITSKTLTHSLSPLLEKQFRSVFDNEVIETRIHPEHCDLLLYNEGDFFNFHRDKILRFPFRDDVTQIKVPKFCGMDVPAHVAGANRDNYMYRESRGEWHMYSVILCLDSNLKSQSLRDDGNTVVCLPSSSFLQHKKMLEYHFSEMAYGNVLNPTSYNVVSKKKLVHHVFHQSVTPGNFVIFPSSALHSSTAITQLGGYKYVLKMDLWVLIPHPQERVRMYCDLLQKFGNMAGVSSKIDDKYLYGPGFLLCQEVKEIGKKRCNCKLCNPRPVEVKHVYQNLSAYFKNTLHPNIWSVIAEFLTILEIKKPIYLIPDMMSLAYTTRMNGGTKTFDETMVDLLGPTKIDIKHIFRSPTGLDLDFMDWDTKKSGFHLQKPDNAADVALSLALTGKLFTQGVGHYYDYYDYLKSKNPVRRHQRSECICNRLSTPEYLEDAINEFKVTTCECTCVGCYIECMGDDWSSHWWEEHDDHDYEEDCNAHSDLDYDSD